MTAQIDNQQLVSLLSSHFWRKTNPGLALLHTMSFLKTRSGHLSSWFASDINETGEMRNQNGVDDPLTVNGLMLYNYDGLIPYVHIGEGSYLSTAVPHNISGTETFIETDKRGLVMAGVFRPLTLSSVYQAVIGKYQADTDKRSYIVWITSGGQLQFTVNVNGAYNYFSVTMPEPMALNKWHYFCARCDTDSETIYLRLDDTEITGTGPSSIYTDNGTGVSIGAEYNGDTPADIDFAWGAVYNMYHGSDFPFLTRELSYPVYR